MATQEVKIGCKHRGRRAYFALNICQEIARLYFQEDKSAEELVEIYKHLSPKGELSKSAIRAMALRGAAANAKTPADESGGCPSTEADAHVQQEKCSTSAPDPSQGG